MIDEARATRLEDRVTTLFTWLKGAVLAVVFLGGIGLWAGVSFQSAKAEYTARLDEFRAAQDEIRRLQAQVADQAGEIARLDGGLDEIVAGASAEIRAAADGARSRVLGELSEAERKALAEIVAAGRRNRTTLSRDLEEILRDGVSTVRARRIAVETALSVEDADGEDRIVLSTTSTGTGFFELLHGTGARLLISGVGREDTGYADLSLALQVPHPEKPDDYRTLARLRTLEAGVGARLNLSGRDGSTDVALGAEGDPGKGGWVNVWKDGGQFFTLDE